MADLSTEPKMMRSQQDKDTPETISEDELAPRKEARDSDEASGRDRELSKTGEATYANEQMNSIFEQNGGGGTKVAPDEAAEDAATDGRQGLVRSGRSRLED
mgnify:FL=1